MTITNYNLICKYLLRSILSCEYFALCSLSFCAGRRITWIGSSLVILDDDISVAMSGETTLTDSNILHMLHWLEGQRSCSLCLSGIDTAFRVYIQMRYNRVENNTEDVKTLMLKKQIDYLRYSDGNFERTIFFDGFLSWWNSCWREAGGANTCPKRWFDRTFFKAAHIQLSLLKMHDFITAPAITILTHSNKGLPLQLQWWGTVSKGGEHADAGCV